MCVCVCVCVYVCVCARVRVHVRVHVRVRVYSDASLPKVFYVWTFYMNVETCWYKYFYSNHWLYLLDYFFLLLPGYCCFEANSSYGYNEKFVLCCHIKFVTLLIKEALKKCQTDQIALSSTLGRRCWGSSWKVWGCLCGWKLSSCPTVLKEWKGLCLLLKGKETRQTRTFLRE